VIGGHAFGFAHPTRLLGCKEWGVEQVAFERALQRRLVTPSRFSPREAMAKIVPPLKGDATKVYAQS
jgi:hypothetical protein